MNDLPSHESEKRLSIKRLLPLLLIGGSCIPFFSLGYGEYLSFETLKTHREEIVAWTDENYPLAVLAFIGAYIMIISMSLPGGVMLTLIGGFLFGTLETTVYVVFGATIGATISGDRACTP